MKLVGGKCLFVIKIDVEMNKLLKMGLHFFMHNLITIYFSFDFGVTFDLDMFLWDTLISSIDIRASWTSLRDPVRSGS